MNSRKFSKKFSLGRSGGSDSRRTVYVTSCFSLPIPVIILFFFLAFVCCSGKCQSEIAGFGLCVGSHDTQMTNLPNAALVMSSTKNLLFLICILPICWARPDGAPKSACSSLAPSHNGLPAQGSDPPYTISAVKNGDKVRVTLSSPIGEEFEGFIIQARSSNVRSRIVEGTFTTSADSKTIDCFDGKKNTLTQVRPDTKTEIVSEWTPSSNIHEDVVFRATVAKTFYLFWTEIDSRPIRVKSSGGSRESSSQTTNMDRSSIYDGCASTKGCFGYESGCVNRGDCDVLLTFTKKENGILFTLYGYLDPQRYMAFGLSQDSIMGDDSVTECIRDNDGSTVYARTSYNQGKSNIQTQNLPPSRYESSFSNGLTTCSWTSPFLTRANGKTYNLVNNSYYGLLATGSLRGERLSYHTGRIATAENINFSAVEAVEDAGVSDSIKIHGTFMCTAWIVFVSLGILMARHFKNTWENSTLGGVKIWFAIHRAFMIAALGFVVVAFIVIFVHKNGWNYETKNPHAILGCIATALGLFQPIMAAFRPPPDHPKRPIFNWMHWAVGNAAHIIAIITIFFAVSLESSGLKESFYWAMAIFVVVHVVFHLMFQMHLWTSTKKKNNDLGMNEITSGRTNNAQNIQAKNVTENVFRILLLGIYGIFLLVIIVALYALIGVA